MFKKFNKYDPEKQKEFIGLINESIQHTYKLLDNLLLWSRSQRGIIEFNRENENLYLISAETIQLLKQSASVKSISIENRISENLYVNADKDKLSTIIRNLISNAVKYTHKRGEIIINAKEIIDKNSQKSVELLVKDNRIGMLPEVKSKLFNISESNSIKGTENETGTGLGLILCKDFTEKHGGKIRVESEIGKG